MALSAQLLGALRLTPSPVIFTRSNAGTVFAQPSTSYPVPTHKSPLPRPFRGALAQPTRAAPVSPFFEKEYALPRGSADISENTLAPSGDEGAVPLGDYRDIRLPELKQVLSLLEKKWTERGDGEKRPGPGNVYLVGTGPGDPELLTVKAHRLMQSADLVLYDRLVSTEILDMVSDKARLLYVGKTAGYHTRTQVSFTFKGIAVSVSTTGRVSISMNDWQNMFLVQSKALYLGDAAI